METTWLEETKKFSLSPSGSGGKQASLKLLETSDSNVITNPKLSRICLVLDGVASCLNGVDAQGKECTDYDWIYKFTADCKLASHNASGLPRTQFIEALKAEAVALDEKRKQRLLDVSQK